MGIKKFYSLGGEVITQSIIDIGDEIFINTNINNEILSNTLSSEILYNTSIIPIVNNTTQTNNVLSFSFNNNRPIEFARIQGTELTINFNGYGTLLFSDNNGNEFRIMCNGG